MGGFYSLSSNLYNKAYRNDEHVEYAKTLGTDLLTVFKRRIERHHFYDKSTKKNALAKLNSLKFILGNPDKMRYDPLLKYSPDDAWGNMLKLEEWKTQKYLNLEGHEVIDIPQFDWSKIQMSGCQSYVVNAHYYPTLNALYILQVKLNIVVTFFCSKNKKFNH